MHYRIPQKFVLHRAASSLHKCNNSLTLLNAVSKLTCGYCFITVCQYNTTDIFFIKCSFWNTNLVNMSWISWIVIVVLNGSLRYKTTHAIKVFELCSPDHCDLFFCLYMYVFENELFNSHCWVKLLPLLFSRHKKQPGNENLRQYIAPRWHF